MHMPAQILIVDSMAKKKKSYSASLVLNSFTALKAAIIPLAGIQRVFFFLDRDTQQSRIAFSQKNCEQHLVIYSGRHHASDKYCILNFKIFFVISEFIFHIYIFDVILSTQDNTTLCFYISKHYKRLIFLNVFFFYTSKEIKIN